MRSLSWHTATYPQLGIWTKGRLWVTALSKESAGAVNGYGVWKVKGFLKA